MDKGGKIIPELVNFAEALSKKLTEEILGKISEKFESRDIDDFTKEVIKQSIEATINPNLIDYTTVPQESKKEEKIENSEKLETITYAEALSKLGGKEEINKFKKLSEELSGKLSNEILDNEIKRMLPRETDWKAFSTKLVNQPYVKNIDELYDFAKPVYPVFKKIIEDLAEETNSIAVVPKVKGKERTLNKAHFKYRDQNNGLAFYRVTDVVRGTIEFPDIPSMYQGAQMVFKHGRIKVKEFNDRYQHPKKGGYRDIQFVIEIENFMCELQLSTKVMRQAKETSGHRNYEVYRELLAAVTDGDIKHVGSALEFGKEQLGLSMKSGFMQDKNCRILPHQAAKNGQTEILDLLLESGADPNAKDDLGDTPLHHAIFHGHERCVWLLLSKYHCMTDSANNLGETPLLKGYFMIYGLPAEPQRRAMITLLQAVDLQQVKQVVQIKDTILQRRLHNSRHLVDYAADGDTALMRESLKKFSSPNSSKDGETALLAAIRNGRNKVVELLLKFNVSLENQGAQKLIVQEALDNNHTDIAYALIKAGANCKNTNWREIVEYAKKGNIEGMEELLLMGIDPDSKWNGVTALRAAVHGKCHEAAKLLLKNRASTVHSFGEMSLVQEAIDLEDFEMKKILIDSGADCKNIAPLQKTIPCRIYSSNFWNWNGIANYKNKLFCTPYDASTVLIIDGDTKKCRYIPCGMGSAKWSGMIRYGTKLFCAPHSAASVLAIDGGSEKIRMIPCNVEGKEKWYGIARCGTKLFCAPYNASSILVIDAKTEEMKTIPCDVPGNSKWCGIVQCGTKLFCAPHNASSVLVIDSESEEIHTIACDKNFIVKGAWSGIACYEGKVYCAPSNASSVLVIDGDTEITSYIPCNTEGPEKWSSITRFGNSLVCSPSRASSILMIDGRTNEITTRSCIEAIKGQAKWSDIAQYGTSLFCSPALYREILIFEDQALQLTVSQVKRCKNIAGSRRQLSGMGKSFLFDFARDGNVLEMEKLLQLDVNPDSQKDGVTALQVAVQEGHTDVVELLLTRAASVGKSKCIVTDAIEYGHLEIAKVLCKYGAGYNRFVEHAGNGNTQEMVKLMKELNISPNSASGNGPSALQAAVRGGHEESVKLLLQHDSSSINDNPGMPIMQEALDFNRNIDIAQLLFDHGASCENVGLSPRNIPLGSNDGDNSDWKWGGIATYKNKIFCSPHHSSSILIIDGSNEEVRSIPCGIEGNKKWLGIACYGKKIFCSPYCASEILVIDGETEEIHTIPCGVEGQKKWHHIAVYGNKLFCAPYSASSVLVIDGETEEIRTIPCEEGDWKWAGIALCGTKLFCAPYTASSILVIDGESEKIHTIPFLKTTDSPNYTAIACYKNKLYCAPWGASPVLVIDGEREETKYIETGIHSNMKWLGVTLFGSKLFFSPCQATSILIIDGETDEISTQPCTEEEKEKGKWGSITKWEEKLFLCPFQSDSILVLEDRRQKLNGYPRN